MGRSRSPALVIQHITPACRALIAFALTIALLASGCKEQYLVGDHIIVEWEGADYPGVVVSCEGPARYRVHYDGYDSIWDENVNVVRIKGRVAGPVATPPPPAKVMRRGGGPMASASASVVTAQTRYKVGARVRVQWNGKPYGATVLEVLPAERYRVHYDGMGSEWDETIEPSRVLGSQ